MSLEIMEFLSIFLIFILSVYFFIKFVKWVANPNKDFLQSIAHSPWLFSTIIFIASVVSLAMIYFVGISLQGILWGIIVFLFVYFGLYLFLM